jgi:hypothetical protein
MPRWLARWHERRILRAATDEIMQFLLQLRGFDRAEIGLVAAQAAHVARHFKLAIGLDLLEPQMTMLQVPGALRVITEAVLTLQRQGEPFRAPGFMVWVHTLRAEQRPEIRYLAKEMWSQLERGFDEAELAGFEFCTTTGHELIVDDDFLQVPRGYKAGV